MKHQAKTAAEQTPATGERKRGRPFAPGQSGNPRGRPPGTTKPVSLALPEAISAVELASKGRTPRQIARLLKAKPEAVKEALSQSRRLLEVCSTKFAEHWLMASERAALGLGGDHRPAMAALQSIKVVEPVAQTYDVNGASAKAAAVVKVELHNFSFAGLPLPKPAADGVINVTAMPEGETER